ncbi:MAG: hypothetical protein ABI547_11880, partial [Betaproteobacteria bacterium]
GKPIRMIDPYAPGGSTEAQARVIGQKLTELWGQPVTATTRGLTLLVRNPRRGMSRRVIFKERR